MVFLMMTVEVEVDLFAKIILTHFWPMSPLYTPWKHQKTKAFLVFSGDMKWENWPEIG